MSLLASMEKEEGGTIKKQEERTEGEWEEWKKEGRKEGKEEDKPTNRNKTKLLIFMLMYLLKD